MNKYRPLILVSALLLASCIPVEDLPSDFETPVPSAPLSQSATSSESAPASAPAQNYPDLVWLPFAHSSESHEGKLLTVRAGQGAFEASPVEIGMFWDYTPLTGRIAFASHFWQADEATGTTSVSDLWIYDYASGESEMWWGDHVLFAAWSPALDEANAQQYLAAALDDGSLALFTGPNEFRIVSSEATHHFSWSPDGRRLAYLKDGGLFLVSVDGSQPNQLTQVTTNNVDGQGWIEDRPVWALEHQAILYTKAPFEMALLDNSDVFTPHTADGTLPGGERAYHMLWSPENRMLVVETEELNGFRVWIYELSPDLRTILSTDSFERIESEPVAAWWVPGESILLRNGDVWSISEKTIIQMIR